MADTYVSLKIKCAEAGTNITAVCRKAGVDRSTIEKWKKKDPESIRILRKMELAIDAIKAGK